jgi:serine/threonine-protein kinase
MLSEGNTKLDCSEVDEIEASQLDLLFSQIPREWKSLSHINGFIYPDTLSESLRQKIIDYFNLSKPSRNNRGKIGQQIRKIKIEFEIFSDSLSNSARQQPVIIIGASVTIISILLLLFKYIEFSTKPKVSLSSITIGTLWKPDDYIPLTEYLKDKLIPNDFFKFLKGEKIKIVNEGDKSLKYRDAQKRIAAKEWDIAFTLSPVISVTAKNSGYTFIARMFPELPPYYRSAMYVRSDSKIQSLADLKPTTTIALGDFNSASSFYIPIYDLFGKTLTVKTGFRGQEIREMVQDGKVDVGVGAYGDTVKERDANIRVIRLSRKIPGSGVYISPSLSTSDSDTIKKLLLTAPAEVKKKANYGADQELDYRTFIGIIQKTDKVLGCTDFSKNPVDFFCDAKQSVPQPVNPVNLTAVVNGFSYINNNIIRLDLESQSTSYRVAMFKDTLLQATHITNPIGLQDKQVKIVNVVPKKITDDSFDIIIHQPNQLQVIN